MLTDKEAKKWFRKVASDDPDKYYATEVLKKEGFTRHKCEKCGKYFWSTDKNRKFCGDPACSGGFRFFENNPCKEKLGYLGVWQKFSKMFKKLGYTPIKRYPVVARWRSDMDFVIASITDFQPYVVSGEVSPPANPLVVPQFCLRFGDIDNVGITGSHMTCFNMIGQHMFVPPDKWDQNKVFRHIKKWINEGLGIPDSEITFHEDAWAGGGNFGPCMEYFCRGVELGNQVYMLYEQTEDEPKELSLKVLDMGMGMERCAWFSQGTPTIYDASFPYVMKKLIEKTNIKYNKEIIKKYVPYSGFLNIDEVEDINKAWKDVAEKVGMSVEELKKTVLPMAALYSVAEHARGLLIALSDGALPSNVGGGYNLRMLARRSFSFIDKYKWNIDLSDVCRWHAHELKEEFPELSENLDSVEKIINVEKEKYENTKQKSRQIIQKLVKEKITDEKLLQLYDSQGIDPEIIKEEALKLRKQIKIPDNFYSKISELHTKKEKKTAEKKQELGLKGVKETEILYFEDYKKTEFKAKVLKIVDKNIILDKTAFYPTSGGQDHDNGKINSAQVIDVFKQGNVVVHIISCNPDFKEGDEVKGEIDFERRIQLTHHHTSAHIINEAAREVLGPHVNQAGAKKTVEKAHLDVTHYQSISNNELKKIEKLANDIVNKKIPIKTSFMPRSEAEKRYGMNIYQGGAVPGKTIRIVEIQGLDVEACAGTHLKNTSEVGKIKILRSTKIQDGVVRIEFVAGKKAEKEVGKTNETLDELSRLLKVNEKQIPARVEEIFIKWKKAKKALKKKSKLSREQLTLESRQEFDGDIIAKSTEILKTQPEHLVKTVKRFLDELECFKKKLI
ncbi:MAG: alanine--tRNA ligase [Candidatus Nanoarchaeia archaeon]|nr:alanine--tRNA ligase [Candidatus Nanoarchaeia archaeon]